MTLSASPLPPDLRSAGTAAVLVGHWYLPRPAEGPAAFDDILRRLTVASSPASVSASPREDQEVLEVLSATCFLDAEGATALVYAECANTESLLSVRQAIRAVTPMAAVEYRLRRSLVLDVAARPPRCVVAATFDVDGPERQEFTIDSVVRQLPVGAARPPGMLAAHFHASADGTRVLNYAEWVSDEAHIAFLAGQTRSSILRLTEATPGVRPIGFRRYHVYRSLHS